MATRSRFKTTYCEAHHEKRQVLYGDLFSSYVEIETQIHDFALIHSLWTIVAHRFHTVDIE
jgi:hypothetical protein